MAERTSSAPERTVTREQVLRFRFRRHQLDRRPGSAEGPTDVDLLDVGVQDTGPDGAGWALVVRGVELDSLASVTDDVALAWTLRGAPHAYRRVDLKAVAVATAPWSEADAAKRIFDASRPLNQAGRPMLDALREVAAAERALARKPIVKGDMSGALNRVLGAEFQRWCRVCQATHIYEMPFRIAALQAGLELEPGTSPPVLKRVPELRPNRYQHLADEAVARHDVVRGAMRFFGPTTAREVVTFLDAAQKDVKAHWPDDVAEVSVQGTTGSRFVLAADLDALDEAADAPAAGDVVVRLVGPYDGFLQGRDREVLVPDTRRHKAVWPTIGRPGAVLADGQVVALWRPKTTSKGLTVRLEPWGRLTKARRTAIEHESERLARFRAVTLLGLTDES